MSAALGLVWKVINSLGDLRWSWQVFLFSVTGRSLSHGKYEMMIAYGQRTIRIPATQTRVETAQVFPRTAQVFARALSPFAGSSLAPKLSQTFQGLAISINSTAPIPNNPYHFPQSLATWTKGIYVHVFSSASQEWVVSLPFKTNHLYQLTNSKTSHPRAFCPFPPFPPQNCNFDPRKDSATETRPFYLLNSGRSFRPLRKRAAAAGLPLLTDSFSA